MNKLTKIISVAACVSIISCTGLFTACSKEEVYEENGFKYTLSDDGKGYVVSSYEGSEEKVEVPSQYQGKPVTAIGENAFFGNGFMTTVFVPDSVTSIGARAFGACSVLKDMRLPFIGESRTATNEKALFGYIFGQKPYKAGTAVKQYYAENKFALYYLPEKLDSLTINGDLSYGALSNVTSLNSVVLEDRVYNVADRAFENSNIKAAYIYSSAVVAAAIDEEACGGLMKCAELFYIADTIKDVSGYIADISSPVDVTITGETFKFFGKEQTYRFECEDAVLEGWTASNASGSNASGNGFISAGAGGPGKVATFTFTSNIATKAKLGVCLGRHLYAYKFNDFLSVTVNGEHLDIENFVIDSPGEAFNWHNWKDYTIAEIDLQAGETTISFTTLSEIGMNVDYVFLTTSAFLA